MSLTLYLDAQSSRLVQSPTSTTSAVLPSFIQGDIQLLRLYPLEPQDNLNQPFTALDWSNVTVRVGIGEPTGTIGSPTPVVEATLTWDAGLGAATGLIAIDEMAVETFVGADRKSTR